MFARANQAQLLHSGQRNLQLPWGQIRRGLGFLLLVAVLAGVYFKLADPDTLPIQKIRAQGSFVHVDEPMLQRVVGVIHGGYFNVDVAQVQADVERLPWVDKASVRRVWPDTLAISVQEQQTLAIWQDGGLINPRGELFSPAPETYPAGLPVLMGPQGLHRIVLARYRTAEPLLGKLGLRVTKLSLDARRAVQLQLHNGMTLVLGRHDYAQRLQRFIDVYPKLLAPRAGELARVDLRYTNGLAVTWKQQRNKQ